jgi:hypothetical protein
LRRTARVQRSAEASPQRMRAEERNESVNVCAKRGAQSTCLSPHRILQTAAVPHSARSCLD